MTITVTIDCGYAKGKEVAVDGLGLLPNLTPVVLSAEQVKAFESRTGVAIGDYYSKSPQVSITTTESKKTEEVTK